MRSDLLIELTKYWSVDTRKEHSHWAIYTNHGWIAGTETVLELFQEVRSIGGHRPIELRLAELCKLKGCGSARLLIDEALERKMSVGEIGCWLSHLFVLDAISRGEFPVTMILEDDIVMGRGTQDELAERLDLLESAGIDWEVCFAGSYSGADWAPTAPAELLPGGFFRMDVETRGAPGTWGYIVTRDGARKLLHRMCRRPIDKPVDELFPELCIDGLKVFCASPSMMSNSDSERLIKYLLKNSRMDLPDPDFNSATMKRIVRKEHRRRILNDILLSLFVFIATDALILLALWLSGLTVFHLADGSVKVINQLLFQVGQLKEPIVGNNLMSYLLASLGGITAMLGIRLVLKSDNGLFLR